MARTEPTPVSRRLLPTLLPENEDDMDENQYEITVCAFGLSSEAAEAMFDRVAEAAHALDEETFVTGGFRAEVTN